MEATVGSIVINDLLPDDLKDYNRVLDKKTTGKLLTTLAKRYPDLYKDISHKLLQFGYQAAYLTGGQSFGLDDIKESSVVKEIRDKIENETQDILEKWYNKGVESDDPRVEKEIIGVVQKYYKALNDGALQEKKDADSPFYRQAFGVGAQKPGTFNSIVGADLLYEDQNAKPVAIPVTRSYSKGLTPVQYFAGSFGARKGVVDLQQATADAGFFAKQLVQIAHREVCVGDDDPEEYDETNPRGYPVETLDPDNEGSYLAHPVGGYARNTLLTPKILQELHKKGIDKILVRSTIVGGPANGGIYAYDAGVREFGRRPAAGEFVGISAVQSFTEKLTQTAISCLHPGTRVRMWDGSVKKLRDIKIGDELLGSDKNGRLGKTTVKNIFHQGVQPVYRHVYRHGDSDSFVSLYATMEHKVLQMTRKSSCKGERYNGIPRILPAGEPCSRTCCVFASGCDPRDGIDEPRALLLGLMLGNGCYTEAVGHRPHLSCADPTQVAELEDYLASIDLRLSFHKGSQCYYRVVGLNNEGDGDNTRNPARVMLDEYGLLGKYAHEKSIPEVAWNWSSESISALLSGLWDTDGSIYKAATGAHYHTAYGSTSLKLVKQIENLLFITTGAHCSNIYANDGGDRKRTLYTVVYANPNEVKKVLEFLRLHGTKETARRTALEDLDAFISNLSLMRHFFTGKRQSQEWFGNVETMDIEVDNEDHLFVLANGLIVSNSKHSGGVVGADSAKGISGFKHLNQLIQVPKHFPQGAAHSTVDGRVDRIQEAPQGGTYIFIDGHRHYVPQQQGQTVGLKVKVGDEVEAGDVLSEGIPNPALVVKYKGIGEGRRAFVQQFQQALKDAGINTHRRNVEALSRGLINYVRLTDEYGDYATDDIIPYTMIASSYKPRLGCVEDTPENCKNFYLEKPVLHYTIGTRITPSVIKTLKDYGVKNVLAHHDAPPFEPEMVRGMAHVSKDPDWGTRLLGGYNKDSLLEAARRGGVSYTKGTSYVPALAFGDPEFGEEGAISKRKDDWWTE